VISGVGAAGTAIIRLLHTLGAATSSRPAAPASCTGARPYRPNRRWIADHTNRPGHGFAHRPLAGADVFIGVSARTYSPGRYRNHGERAIVFALANPDPEIDPP